MRKFAMVAAVLLYATTAQAGSAVWKDGISGFSFSYPDSWSSQTVDTPSVKARIAGPIAEDDATCRMKAVKDGRIKIYPKKLVKVAVPEFLNREFWQSELDQYENGIITEYYAPASMGSMGDATAIKATWVQDFGAGKVVMYGTMIGSLYGDSRYVMTCSARKSAYRKYAPLFYSMMTSVKLDSQYAPFATGAYRDFLADAPVLLPHSQPGTDNREAPDNLLTRFKNLVFAP